MTRPSTEAQKRAAHEERMRKVVRDAETGCWTWTGARTGKRMQYPVAAKHRAIYETLVGPIPPVHDLHHECGNTLCVNPDHLRPVPRAEHRRSHMLGNQHAKGARWNHTPESRAKISAAMKGKARRRQT